MARLRTNENQLLVELSFWEKFGGLSKGIAVPLSNIKKVSWSAKLNPGELGLRVGGTGMPRVIALGNFYKKGELIFSAWRRGQEVLILEISNHRFKKLVLGCEDASNFAKELNARV